MMKILKIIIVQTTPEGLEGVKKGIKRKFPELLNNITFNDNFESTLELIPKEGEIIVITSNIFHDKKNELLPSHEKNGNKLAELIKEINATAKVYIFSANYPYPDESIDGFYKKRSGGHKIDEDIVEFIRELRLAENLKVSEKRRVLKNCLNYVKSFFEQF